jgi:hypothetical protein
VDGKDDGSPPILTVNCPIVQLALTVAALEDKIVQQAVATILNQIYEEDFLGFCVLQEHTDKEFTMN